MPSSDFSDDLPIAAPSPSRGIVPALAALLCILLHAGSAQAQTCNGFGSIHTGPWNVAAGAAWSDTSSRFLTYVQHAWGNAIAGVGYSVTSLDNIEPKSTMLFGGGGYEFPLQREGRVTLCAGFEGGLVKGPDIAPLNVSGWATQATARTGFVVAKTTSFELIPNVGISSLRTSLNAKGAGIDVNQSDTTGLLHLGVGFVFGRRVALVPTLTQSLEHSEDQTFDFFVALTLGK